MSRMDWIFLQGKTLLMIVLYYLDPPLLLSPQHILFSVSINRIFSGNLRRNLTLKIWQSGRCAGVDSWVDVVLRFVDSTKYRCVNTDVRVGGNVTTCPHKQQKSWWVKGYKVYTHNNLALNVHNTNWILCLCLFVCDWLIELNNNNNNISNLLLRNSYVPLN